MQHIFRRMPSPDVQLRFPLLGLRFQGCLPRHHEATVDNLEPYWNFVHTAKKAHDAADRFGPGYVCKYLAGLGFRVKRLGLGSQQAQFRKGF